MKDKYHDGICMMCHTSPTPVRYIDLYLIGSEGFWCCKTCEEKILDFIREERARTTHKALQEHKERVRRRIIMTPMTRAT